MIRLGNEHIDVKETLSLVSLLRQYVSRMRMAPLDFSGGRQPHSLGRTFVRLKFRHCDFPFFIADFQLPIADLFQLAIGNRQSAMSLLSGRFRFPALMSLWSKNDEHLVPFHPWPRFNLTDVGEVVLKPLQDPRT